MAPFSDVILKSSPLTGNDFQDSESNFDEETAVRLGCERKGNSHKVEFSWIFLEELFNLRHVGITKVCFGLAHTPSFLLPSEK